MWNPLLVAKHYGRDRMLGRRGDKGVSEEGSTAPLVMFPLDWLPITRLPTPHLKDGGKDTIQVWHWMELDGGEWWRPVMSGEWGFKMDPGWKWLMMEEQGIEDSPLFLPRGILILARCWHIFCHLKSIAGQPDWCKLNKLSNWLFLDCFNPKTANCLNWESWTTQSKNFALTLHCLRLYLRNMHYSHIWLKVKRSEGEWQLNSVWLNLS